MADKKSGRRFTIQFNRKDPAHLRVSDILNGLEWRGKAQYVVNAVLYYINREPALQLDEKHIEEVVNRILRDSSYGGADAMPVPVSVGGIETPPIQ